MISWSLGKLIQQFIFENLVKYEKWKCLGNRRHGTWHPHLPAQCQACSTLLTNLHNKSLHCQQKFPKFSNEPWVLPSDSLQCCFFYLKNDKHARQSCIIRGIPKAFYTFPQWFIDKAARLVNPGLHYIRFTVVEERGALLDSFLISFIRSSLKTFRFEHPNCGICFNLLVFQCYPMIQAKKQAIYVRVHTCI